MHLRNLVAAGALALACMLSVSGAFAAPSVELVLDTPSFVDVLKSDRCSPMAAACNDELADVALLSPGDEDEAAAFTCSSVAQGLSPDPIGDMLRRYDPGWCSS